MAEQRGIASRMFANFPELLDNANISAISTYSPRAVQSMYEFTHQLTEYSNKMNINTSEGPKYSPLLRFFDTNNEYIKFRTTNSWKKIYDEFLMNECPTAPIRKLIGDKYVIDDKQLRELAFYQYYIID